MTQIRLLLLCILCAGNAAYGNTALQKLIAVNSIWREHAAAAPEAPQYIAPEDETAWIQYHLRLVEAALRSETPINLTRGQRAARKKCLDALCAYYRAGRFPINDQRAFRTPVFIDRSNTFCAVGYLIKTSDCEPLARRIAAIDNFAYVRDMRIPALREWAAAHGFTADELAWIQPGYPQHGSISPVGRGTDGVVYELCADAAKDRLYIGGSFRNVDSAITAGNVAYITDSSGNFAWHALDSGVNGPVRAIAIFRGDVFVAGSFTRAGSDSAWNVARWDGQSWKAGGCLGGDVRDLAVMGGRLYAGGSLTTCALPDTVGLAEWDGTAWQPIRGLVGTVNTLYAEDTTLIAGGAFVYAFRTPNVIRWSRGTGFSAFGVSSANEITSFAKYGGILYAGCNRPSTRDDTALILTCSNNSWQVGLWNTIVRSLSRDSGALAFRTLCPTPDGLMYGGGSFNYFPGVGCWAQNAIIIRSPYGFDDCDAFSVNGPVYKMEVFHQNLFTGGSFGRGLNGLGRTPITPLAVPKVLSTSPIILSPNPVHGNGVLSVHNPGRQSGYIIVNAAGAQVMQGTLERGAKGMIRLAELSPGEYFLYLESETRGGAKFTVR